MNESLRQALPFPGLRPSPGLRPPADPGSLTLVLTVPFPHPPNPLQSAFEAELSEISISQTEINLALRNLRAWMKDEKVSKNLVSDAGVRRPLWVEGG